MQPATPRAYTPRVYTPEQLKRKAAFKRQYEAFELDVRDRLAKMDKLDALHHTSAGGTHLLLFSQAPDYVGNRLVLLQLAHDMRLELCSDPGHAHHRNQYRTDVVVERSSYPIPPLKSELPKPAKVEAVTIECRHGVKAEAIAVVFDAMLRVQALGAEGIDDKDPRMVTAKADYNVAHLNFHNSGVSEYVMDILKAEVRLTKPKARPVAEPVVEGIQPNGSFRFIDPPIIRPGDVTPWSH